MDHSKNGGEGVIAIFLKKALKEELLIYGTGDQTRDFLYVKTVQVVVQAGYSDKVNGEIINAGLGRDISINDLILLIAEDERK